MGGQLAICDPAHDFLFVCTSDTQGAPAGYAFIYDYLRFYVLDRLQSDALPRDDAAYNELQSLLSGLKIALPAGESSSEFASQVDGVRYRLNPNPMGIRAFVLHFDGDGGALVLDTDPARLRVRIRHRNGSEENGFGYLSPESSVAEFGLRPGENLLHYVPQGDGSRSVIRVRWYDCWEGV